MRLFFSLALATSVIGSKECVPYGYPPVTAALSHFPPIWRPVRAILSSDSAGHSRFLEFSSSIPNIAPKVHKQTSWFFSQTSQGTLGVLSGKSYPSSDPDCWWTYSTCVSPKLKGLKPDIASPRTLGYGFDDGPNCSHNAFYDYLNKQNQKATVFFIGSNVLDWPKEAQRAVADGHEICVHTWSHSYMTAFTNEQAFAELWYTMQAIKLVTGYTPTCWRPPSGDVDDRIRYIAARLGLDTILWKYNTNDWEVGINGVTPATVQANYDALVAAARKGTFNTKGAIILAHELNNYTMQTAMNNYPQLAQAFDHIVPIAVAQNKTHPYVETNLSMPTFAQYVGSHKKS
ncbi:Carbohydrate esterase family 4 protein [Mycena indigotica]|uniref:chitin deacetylase n=1 Tax=Mycena indigotica TaxID=2126181 RepID=A0A8H6SN59_9AGAR|nr:Carbohydrate esterase family 4 protein [Mycena indigotica]KAF7301882.1 Carbohydrate esterase family 4 protein [Mycena indigotica]